jgi:hypothetical protein
MNANILCNARVFGVAGALALVLVSGSAEAITRNVSGGTRTNINANRNVNVNRNIDANRNINVDVDRHYEYGQFEHPVAAAAAVGALTAAAVGSIGYELPPSCTLVEVNGVAYQNCDGVWYEPQFDGTSVQYVAVGAPP